MADISLGRATSMNWRMLSSYTCVKSFKMSFFFLTRIQEKYINIGGQYDPFDKNIENKNN